MASNIYVVRIKKLSHVYSSSNSLKLFLLEHYFFWNKLVELSHSLSKKYSTFKILWGIMGQSRGTFLNPLK